MFVPARTALLTCFLLLIPGTLHAQAAPPDFRRDVKPILQKHCYVCHGADAEESGLRLDAAALVLRGGNRGPAVVKGESGESRLYRTIAGTDPDVARMPLDSEPLSDAELAVVREWIDAGAAVPADEPIPEAEVESDHWAFQPVRRPPPPDVQNRDWPRTPLDRFVLARLEREGLAPSPEADRATLIRRVTLDLTGLLPSPDAVRAFVEDPRPDAYERLVDGLLASPHYGERWGRHWLDLARYADSHGFTIDGPRSIWKYRDWVIDALNRDLPFDRFTTEQLAGDLLPDPTRQQLVATGFHRNTLINQEGGTDKEQFRVEAVVDRVSTTGSVFLGLTVGCAQCHDHKYDPVSQREFYELFAIFNNCSEPKLSLPTPKQSRELKQLRRDLAAAETALKEHDAEFAEGQAAWEQQFAGATQEVVWQPLEPVEYRSAGGATISLQEDGSLLVGGAIPEKDHYTIALAPHLPQVTGLRLEVLTHESLPKGGPGLAANGNFILGEFELQGATADADPAELEAISVATARADWSQKDWPVANALDGDPKTGWAINVTKGSLNVDREAVFVLANSLSNASRKRLVVTLRQSPGGNRYSIGRLRLSATSSPAAALELAPELRNLLAIDPNKRSGEQRKAIHKAYRQTDTERLPLQAEVDRLKRIEKALVGEIATTMIVRENSPRETHIHVRGDFTQKGAPVTPGVPSVLHDLPASEAPPDRLDFARWLTDPENPLTARVTVNRFWQRFFGRGLVATENDFGSQGALPSHPELLDWLADEFVRLAWRQKALHRLIVTSAVYRQSSAIRRELLARDPRNRLLARQSRLRLEAEAIRDAALAASGKLSRRIGGPSVHPPQPEGIYVLTQTRKPWPEDKGENRFRRGVYTQFWRSSPYPFLMTFDAPDATTTCTRRARSNTPLQALTLANDRAFFELAQALAVRVLKHGPSDDLGRLREAFLICLAREPSDAELGRLLEFLDRQRTYFSGSAEAAAAAAPADRPADASEIDGALWTAVARVVMNLDEFITRE